MSDNRLLKRCYKQESTKVSKKVSKHYFDTTFTSRYLPLGRSPQQNHADPGTWLMSKLLMIQGLHLDFGHSTYHETKVPLFYEH